MKYTFCVMLTLAVLTAGCATKPKASFYLVPDPEGKVGEVTVTNKAGSVTLNKANETVGAPSEDKAFLPSRQADSGEIQTKFGEALTLMPPPPKGFNIYFDTGSSNVNKESKGIVEQVLEESKKRDSRDISLNGHTDRLGDAAVNMRLSLDRAKKVKELLLKQGVREEYISIEYYGESKPIVPTADNVSEPKNRRVEVVVR